MAVSSRYRKTISNSARRLGAWARLTPQERRNSPKSLHREMKKHARRVGRSR